MDLLQKDLLTWFLKTYLTYDDALNVLKCSKKLYNNDDLLFCFQMKKSSKPFVEKQRLFFSRNGKQGVLCEICQGFVLKDNLGKHMTKQQNHHSKYLNRNPEKKIVEKCNKCGAIYPKITYSPHMKEGCPYDILFCKDVISKISGQQFTKNKVIAPSVECEYSGTRLQMHHHHKTCKVICAVCNGSVNVLCIMRHLIDHTKAKETQTTVFDWISVAVLFVLFTLFTYYVILV